MLAARRHAVGEVIGRGRFDDIVGARRKRTRHERAGRHRDCGRPDFRSPYALVSCSVLSREKVIVSADGMPDHGWAEQGVGRATRRTARCCSGPCRRTGGRSSRSRRRARAAVMGGVAFGTVVSTPFCVTTSSMPGSVEQSVEDEVDLPVRPPALAPSRNSRLRLLPRPGSSPRPRSYCTLEQHRRAVRRLMLFEQAACECLGGQQQSREQRASAHARVLSCSRCPGGPRDPLSWRTWRCLPSTSWTLMIPARRRLPIAEGTATQ